MKITRRGFLQSAAGASAATVGVGAVAHHVFNHSASDAKTTPYPGELLGASAHLGHQLRVKDQFPKPRIFETTQVAIVGSGVAGLSCGWKLQKAGIQDFKILELEATAGGNARSGENRVSRFPWGAHYIPFLSDESVEARELLADLGVITGYDQNDVPIYNDFYICQAPQERLFHYGKWHDGLLPNSGVTVADQKQADDFFAEMKRWSQKRGRDGRFAFSIPLARSSQEPAFLELDRISMAEFMTSNGWVSTTLRWYVNYCCRDDFGTPFEQVSAWAGIHYFAARRGRASGIEGPGLVTWPEGNAWITRKLSEALGENIGTHSLVYNVEQTRDYVFIDDFNTATQQTRRLRAEHVVMACPRFVAPFLIPELEASMKVDLRHMEYAPWMVANITLQGLPSSGAGAPLAWDNVFYDGRSLGYVVATNQNTQIFTHSTVLTYFLPLDELSPLEERKRAVATSLGQWQELVVADLSRAHPGIASQIQSIDVWLWGHAMIRPLPGFIWGQNRKNLQTPQGRIHFANSDMSGISIFEEAHYHGTQAANAILKRIQFNA
jgi:hypothetical protein